MFIKALKVMYNNSYLLSGHQLRGKGLDLVTLAKDFNLMQWTEANSFRTSHYPYSEELMDLADQMGWMIIDEIPAVSLE